MSLEIERKWLIESELPGDWELLFEAEVETSYVQEEPEIRFRRRGTRDHVMTVKFSRAPSHDVLKRGTKDPLASSMTREEFEFEIGAASYERMTKNLPRMLRFDRHYKLPTGEVLECSETPELGLKVGEIEFRNEEDARSFEPPFDWGPEVTGDKDYKVHSLYLRWLESRQTEESPAPFTQLYYQTEPEVLACSVRVAERTEQGVVVTPELFYPEGGGQPGDTGTLGPWRVLDTKPLVDGRGELILEPEAEPRMGEHYEARVDGERRHRFRAQHTAEHLISGTALRLFGVRNCGFHMNEDEITVDFDRRLTRDEIARLEFEVNRAVWRDAPVRSIVGTEESLASIEYRAKQRYDGPMRLVEIEGLDRCACSALHLDRSGGVGLVRITHESGMRGGSRLTVLVGEPALRDLQTRVHMTDDLARERSCGVPQLPERLAQEQAEKKDLCEKCAALSAQLQLMRLSLIAPSCRRLYAFVDEEAEAQTLAEACLGRPGLQASLVLRPLADREGQYSFKLAAPEGLSDVLAELREGLDLRGGGRPPMAAGRLSLEASKGAGADAVIAYLEELGYESLPELTPEGTQG